MAITVRLPEDLEDAVKTQAEAERVSANAFVIRAVEASLEKSSRRTAYLIAAEKVKAAYGDTLRRLGE